MTRKKRVPGPTSLEQLQHAADDDARNRLVLGWLSDDEHRATLFRLINAADGFLDFPSRDASPPEPRYVDDDHPCPPPVIGHKTIRLVTRRELIVTQLKDGGADYSSRIYAELGGGKFALALDPAGSGAAAHEAQVAAMRASFPHDAALIGRVSHHACQSAAILSLRAQNFDLANFAEQSALRFCQHLFGYANTDFPLLETALRASYKALVHQVLGRHFTTDPVAIPTAKATMGKLLVRTGALIDAYVSGDEDVLKGTEVAGALTGLTPVMEKLGLYRGDLNGEQRAVIAAGAAAGIVGNVQAAVCIAVEAIFADQDQQKSAYRLVRSEPASLPTERGHEWEDLIRAALEANPPIAFLPRMSLYDEQGNERKLECLLALGGGTDRHPGTIGTDDPLIWGLTGLGGKHGCSGRNIAPSLIVEAVRHVMGLPGIAQRLDPLDAGPMGLTKRWGFACESYPLQYKRERRAMQSSLNVAMRIKAPIKANADALREIIRAGAPRIEEALLEARQVHFAWFEFIENDSVLVLHTVYDGDFAAYIQHFALKVGDTFDKLFEHIEVAPPAPISKFPNEFVALIQRYNRTPAMGYFFSAYPGSDAARILRDETARRSREAAALKALHSSGGT